VLLLPICPVGIEVCHDALPIAGAGPLPALHVGERAASEGDVTMSDDARKLLELPQLSRL
jgi:hypothetical protein